MATTTPNMNLTVPVAGDTTPGYVDAITASLNAVDAHDHSAGKGARINAANLTWSTAVDAAGQPLQNLKTTRYADQASLPAASNPRALYSVGGNLYWNNGASGAVQLTVGTALNGVLLGGIAGTYVSSGAQVVYAAAGSGTYTFQNGTLGQAGIVAGSGTFSAVTINNAVVSIPSTTKTYRAHAFRGYTPSAQPITLNGYARPTALNGNTTRWYVAASAPNFGTIAAARVRLYCTGAASGTVTFLSLSAIDGSSSTTLIQQLGLPASPGGNFTLSFSFTPVSCVNTLFYFDFNLTPAAGAANNIGIVGIEYDVTATQLPDVFGG